MGKVWVSFSLGPVQSFISTARTVRDLWAGSYLLSWLTAHAAKSVSMQSGSRFIEPDIQNNSIFKFVPDGTNSGLEQLLIPTIPNRFIVEIDAKYVDSVTEQIKGVVQFEWKEIACCVRAFLQERWKDYPGWDAQWEEQIENCWDARVAVLPLSDDDVEMARALGLPNDVDDLFRARMFLRGLLEAAGKQVRHYPPHEKENFRRQKCALCGERSQQIPQKPLDLSPEEWKEEWIKLTKATIDRGERLQPKDRFCAVELVKRFAWAQYFSKIIFDCDPQKRRIWDTYTIAACGWLSQIQEKSVFDLVAELEQKGREWNRKEGHEERQSWNGSWLYWKTPEVPADKDKDEFDSCPQPVWDAILELRKKAPGSNPPSYYAILMLDGDKMGEKLRQTDEKERQKISAELAQFAMNDVPQIVRQHHGQLIYAGGDDVLAMLPRETALLCARDLSDKFSGHLPGFTLSGGIAVVHVKHDLQDALDYARKAERKAKESGRNRLALSIVKRSGAPETAVILWDQVERMEDLRCKFSDPTVSDRWLYQVAEEWETLEQDCQMLDSEFIRLLSHSDKAPRDAAANFWRVVAGSPKEQRRNTLLLMQQASFLARNNEEK
ncbi:MAG: type III-B CRISPR-associated protein Cas10/Cmr2 [Candidatus Omnitrophica bacterium]|nr:type III-B CRISPR-associated protein Cas10/Cmr2 [Candidatus Omnitrophota bacterium]